jgi:hypothetical protein
MRVIWKVNTYFNGKKEELRLSCSLTSDAILIRPTVYLLTYVIIGAFTSQMTPRCDQLLDRVSLYTKHVARDIFFPNGATAPRGPRPPHYRGFTITLRHTTPGRTPLYEWQARRRDLHLTIHNTHKRQTSMARRDSNPQSHQVNGRRPKP